MTRTVVAAAAFLGAFALAAGGAVAAEGFVPFDPAAQGSVSGASLVIAAYAVVCGLLALYAASLLVRSAAVRRRARALEARLGRTERAGGGGA